MSLKELLSSSVSKAAQIPLVVEAVQNHFKDKEGVSLTIVYEDTNIGPDSTDSQMHEEADTAIPNQVPWGAPAEENGFFFSNDLYMPVMNLNLPAPKAVIELVKH